MASDSMNLWQKMAHVSANVGAVVKSGQHYSGYKFQSIEAVSDALRGLMADTGLMMFSECTSYEWIESHWVCSYLFTFIDVDTGDSKECHWQQSTLVISKKGTIDDKAMGINHSYAQKYFLMRTFLISSNDDLDENSDAQKNKPSESKKQAPKPKAQGKSRNDEIMELTKDLYINADGKFILTHQKNSLNKATKDGVITNDMLPEKVVSVMLGRRLNAQYGLDSSEITSFLSDIQDKSITEILEAASVSFMEI